jgi:hypothetical protein
MIITKDLERILKLYPRGYHSVSTVQMQDILDGYDYQMESPGSIVGRLGVSRETLRVWGKKKIIHYFVRRDKLYRILEAYIPLYTFLDAQLPNTERYEKEVEKIKQELERSEKRRIESYLQDYKKMLETEGATKPEKKERQD